MRQNETTVITGRTVILVPYDRKHVLKYHEWMQSPELQSLTASEPLSLEAEYEMQESWRLDEDKCTFIILDAELYHRTSDEVYETKKTAEIEIMIAEPHFRGKGLGKESLLLMMTYGAQQLSVMEYIAKIGIANERSLSLFESLGFKKVSTSEIFKEITYKKLMSNMPDCNLVYSVSVR